MRVFGSLAVALLLVFLVATPWDDAGARSCYEIWAEADGAYEGHYRHFVYVENDCEE